MYENLLIDIDKLEHIKKVSMPILELIFLNSQFFFSKVAGISKNNFMVLSLKFLAKINKYLGSGHRFFYMCLKLSH